MKKWKKILATGLTLMLAGSVATGFAGVNGEAGSGDFNYADGPADASAFRFPTSLAPGPEGALYILDSGNNVLRVKMNGEIRTLTHFNDKYDPVGLPYGGHIDGPMKDALFNQPKGMVADSQGNLYIADSQNNCIRKIMGNKVYTLSGTGKAGFIDGAPNIAQFSHPVGVTLDGQGNLYVADSGNNAIRKITPKGVVSTVSGEPGRVGHADGVKGQATYNEPQGVVFSLSQNVLYVADTGNSLIRRIASGKTETLAGRVESVDPLSGYAAGGFKDGKLSEAAFHFPKGLALNSKGALFVADTGNSAVRMILGDRVITLAKPESLPDTVTSEADTLSGPTGLTYKDNSLYIADTLSGKIRSLKLEPTYATAEAPKLAEVASMGDRFPTTINGKKLAYTQGIPFLQGKTLYLPVKDVVEAAEGKLFWDSKKSRLTLLMGSKKVVMTKNNGLILKAGRLYLPSATLAKAAGLKIVTIKRGDGWMIQINK